MPGAKVAGHRAKFPSGTMKVYRCRVSIGYLVLVMGCCHEDRLADSADGFGEGWKREKVLVIYATAALAHMDLRH
jgi:cobalamin synthase